MTSALTLMAVHAHPDDESSSTGGILARYGDEGVRTVVVTCTNGEYGDGPDHVKPGDEGHVAEQVAETRLMELAIAGKTLGVDHQELLGYHDSGMPDWPYKDRPDAFCNAPILKVAARLTALFERYEPQVVVTYSDYSGYNHPDHLHAHHVTMAAVERSRIPAKLYLIARRRRDWEELRRRLEAQGVDMPARPALSPEAQRRMEELESRITTTIDTSRAWPTASAQRSPLMPASWTGRGG